MHQGCVARRVFGILVLLGLLSPAVEAADEQQAQLQKLHAYVAEMQTQLTDLQAALSQAEARNREQSGQIDRLERGIQARTQSGPGESERIRQVFFDYLKTHLPASPVYRVEAQKVVVAADPVFVFSRAQLGAEGVARLRDFAAVLVDAVGLFPDHLSWRLSVEGHTDPRPLRSHSAFATNWELSAARATEMVRFLVKQGVAEKRLVAVAWAATMPSGRAGDETNYRRDRRIELHLRLDN